MRMGLLITCGVALVLAATLGLQIVVPSTGLEDAGTLTGVIPASRVKLASTRAVEAAPPTMHADDWTAIALARPLFTRDRRPTAFAAAAASAEGGESLPRLTGVAITPDVRRAIFAGPEGGKPVVVDEGGSISGFTVEAIGPGEVKLQGQSGARTVGVAFDPTPAAPRPDAEMTPTSINQPPYGAPPPYGFTPQAPPMAPPPAGQMVPNQLPGPRLGHLGVPLDPSGMPQNRPGPLVRPRTGRAGAARRRARQT